MSHHHCTDCSVGFGAETCFLVVGDVDLVDEDGGSLEGVMMTKQGMLGLEKG